MGPGIPPPLEVKKAISTSTQSSVEESRRIPGEESPGRSIVFALLREKKMLKWPKIKICTLFFLSTEEAEFFLQSSELGLSQPLTRRRVCPPVLGGGAQHSLAREGLGESQFRRGDIHWGHIQSLVESANFIMFIFNT